MLLESFYFAGLPTEGRHIIAGCLPTVEAIFAGNIIAGFMDCCGIDYLYFSNCSLPEFIIADCIIVSIAAL